MVLCFYHPVCERHDPGANHSENVKRLQATHKMFEEEKPPFLRLALMPKGNRELIALAHGKDYIETVFQNIPLKGQKEIEINTVTSQHDEGEVTTLSPASGEALLYCAGAAKAAVDTVMTTQDSKVFCATRPPGHHAFANKAMGFCIFNNVAIAANYARQTYGVKKVAIIDFDVHHANGTQAIFAQDKMVFHASIHQLPLWPETGYEDDTGVGNLLNIPTQPNTPRELWLQAWREKLLPRIAQEKPEIIFISAGFDAHKDEFRAHQNLETEDFTKITSDLVMLAKQHAQGRVISFLEGGYNVSTLGANVLAHLKGLCD